MEATGKHSTQPCNQPHAQAGGYASHACTPAHAVPHRKQQVFARSLKSDRNLESNLRNCRCHVQLQLLCRQCNRYCPPCTLRPCTADNKQARRCRPTATNAWIHKRMGPKRRQPTIQLPHTAVLPITNHCQYAAAARHHPSHAYSRRTHAVTP